MDWSGVPASLASSRPGIQVELVRVVKAQGGAEEIPAIPVDTHTRVPYEQPKLNSLRPNSVLPKTSDQRKAEPEPEQKAVAVADPDHSTCKKEAAANQLVDDELHLGTRLTKLLAQSVLPGSKQVQPTSYQAVSGSSKANSQSKGRNSPQAAVVEAWVDAQPRYRTNPLPAYPYQARTRQWQGQVWLVVDVDAAGRVEGLEVEHSSGHAVLDRAARQAVRRWQFMPALRAGVPVASRVRVPVRFKLDRS